MLLGSETWRDDWEKFKSGVAREPNFGDFIRIEFARKMETLGYLPTELHEMRPIKNVKGVMYHLAIFSKHMRAKDFWEKASTSSQPQTKFHFD
jgi:hypothetical protein